ncbi:enoyl-CoA hydratase [Pseudonocardiaceae bacterium YIM PH 21723]|nr:enoyl-CoA hydratase [Pseudonocardiaceae bacterium YIM PH 21723]
MTAIEVERTGDVLRVTLNRPEVFNALNAGMTESLLDAIEAPGAGVRVLVITGNGRAFCAGADIGTDLDIGPAVDAANRLIRGLRELPIPVVAAVNGPAVGVGCSIALAADLVVAAESAYFLQSFTNIGLMPDGGATALLPAAIGRARAARMALLGERISADQALNWGLISHCVPDQDLAAEADRLVGRLAAGPTTAYAEIKQALDIGGLPTLEENFAAERVSQVILSGTDDYAEGIAAFREKRVPRFTGR